MVDFGLRSREKFNVQQYYKSNKPTKYQNMDIISQYGSLQSQKHEVLSSHGDFHNHEELRKVVKWFDIIEKQFKFGVTVLLPQRNPSGRILKPSEIISFSILVPSRSIQYQYVFQIDINTNSNVEKIVATIIKNGRLLNVHKEGVMQTICNFSLFMNRSMNIYSLRIHPYTGVLKYSCVQHVTPTLIKEMFQKPVEFCIRIKGHIQKMTNRLNDRLLGKILCMENQIELKQILPSDLSQKLKYETAQNLNMIESKNVFFPGGTLKIPYTQSKKLKQARRYITNSTIKWLFFSKDTESGKIRFAPQIKQKKREKDTFERNVRHNYKIMPFSEDVKKILMQYTANNETLQDQCIYGKIMDVFSVQPTPKEIKDICELLKVDNYMVGGKIYSPMTICSVQHEVPIGVGGFAQISRLYAYIAVRQESENPQMGSNNQRIVKQILVRKSAARQKLYWEKQVIKHIGKGSCVFINRFYEGKVSPQSTLNRAFFQDSILMDYCVERALNNYLGKMNSVISLKNKLFLLFQVSIGLRYLKDHNTVHLDMKPQNILIRVATNVYSGALFPLVKIIDFGEAFCDTLISRNKNRGHTCPYASPELVRQVSNYNEKSDVFSLGVMILVIVFQLNTVDIKRITSSTLFKENPEDYVKFYSICPQKCKYYGYEPVMHCLLSLAYKCIHPNTYLRPYINWVCIILRTLLDIIQCFQM